MPNSFYMVLLHQCCCRSESRELSEMTESWWSLVLLTAIIILFLFLLYLFCDWLVHRSNVVGGAVDRWVLITGCDTGFGHQAAKHLDVIGCRVIAGCLSPESCSILSNACSSRLVPVLMDITNEESVQLAFQTVSGLLGPEHGLWGLVNNAGIQGSLGPVEWLTQEDFESVMEVNVFGLVRVTRTFLPLLKRSTGGARIVNTSSVLGKLSVPYSAPYCMTKHAIEALSDALRVELHPYDIKVAIVEPGGHSTKFLDGTMSNIVNSWNRLPETARKSFGEQYLKQVIFLGTKIISFISSSSLDGVVDAYEHALFSSCPRRRYLVGYDAFVISFSHFVPSAILDFVLNLPGFRAVPDSCRSDN